MAAGVACICLCCVHACGFGKSRTESKQRPPNQGANTADQSREGLVNAAYVQRDEDDPYFIPDDHSCCVKVGFAILIILAIGSVVTAAGSLYGNGGEGGPT